MKKFLLSLCGLIATVSIVSAESVTVTTAGSSSIPYNGSNVTPANPVSVTASKGTDTSATTLGQTGGSNDNQYRLGEGNTMTISVAKGYEITNITCTSSSSSYDLISSKATSDYGTVGTNTITLDEPVNSVTLTFTGAVRFKTIIVTYQEAAVDPNVCIEPVPSIKNGSKIYADDVVVLSSETEGATIVYTINDGDMLTGDSPVEITFREDGDYTIEAFASKDGMTDSESVTFKYTYTAVRPAITTEDKTVTYDFTKNGYGLTPGTTFTTTAHTFANGDVNINYAYGSGSGCRVYSTGTSQDFRVQQPTSGSQNYNTLYFNLAEGIKGTINKIVFTGKTLGQNYMIPSCGSFTMANSILTWEPTEGEDAPENVTLSVKTSVVVYTIEVYYTVITEIEPDPVEPELTEHAKAIGVEGYDKVDVENVEGKCLKIILKHEASLGHNEKAEGAIVLRAAKKQQSEVNMRRVLSATEEVSLTHDHESLNYTDDGKVEITLDHMPEQGDYEMVIPAGFFLVGDSNVSKAQTIGFNVDAEGNGTTGLAEISADKAAAIYDLQGRKVSRAGRGLFIQGGKVVRM